MDRAFMNGGKWYEFFSVFIQYNIDNNEVVDI